MTKRHVSLAAQIVAWLAAALQIGMVLWMAVTGGWWIAFALLHVLVGAAIFGICGLVRARPTQEDRCRHALGWMILSCAAVWPMLVSETHVDAAVCIIIVAICVREVSAPVWRWVLPLGTALCVGLLLPSLRELAPGGVLVVFALVLHVFAMYISKPTEEVDQHDR